MSRCRLAATMLGVAFLPVSLACDGTELARFLEGGQLTIVVPTDDGSGDTVLVLFGAAASSDDLGGMDVPPVGGVGLPPVGPCPDGSFRLRAELDVNDAPSGRAEYRLLPGGCERFRVRVEDFAAGTYDVSVDGLFVGRVTVGGDAKGELELDTEDGTFPAGFPSIEIGAVAIVGDVTLGAMNLHCPDDPHRCPDS